MHYGISIRDTHANNFLLDQSDQSTSLKTAAGRASVTDQVELIPDQLLKTSHNRMLLTSEKRMFRIRSNVFP